LSAAAKPVEIGRRLIAREAIDEFIAVLFAERGANMSSYKSKVSPLAGDQSANCLPLRLVSHARRPKFYTIEQIADRLVVSTRPKIGQQRTILRQRSESANLAIRV
jgi:hypothetical protein